MPGKSTNKKLPSIKIQGKEYVLVSDRVLEFNRLYPEGSITTELVSELESPNIVIKATILPNDRILSQGDDVFINRRFTAYSQAVRGEGFINKTSALENAETSAVGRALAFMGIGVIDSVASVDEINKANSTQTVPPVTVKAETPLATVKQKLLMRDLYTQAGGDKAMLADYVKQEGYDPDKLTMDEASLLIEKLKEGK